MAPVHMGSCTPSTSARADSVDLEPFLRKTPSSWSETHLPRHSSELQTHADLESWLKSKRRT